MIRVKAVIVRAVLVLLSADNLSINNLFGFSEGFAVTRFCRFFVFTREKAETCHSEQKLSLRTKESYNESVLSATRHPSTYDWSTTGIKQGCGLNELQYIHVTSNFCVDVMHYILEEVAPHELSLILTSLNTTNFINLEKLNLAISDFDYSLADKNSQPPTISSFNSIRMSASEMWCFLRNLPVMIGRHIPHEQEHWKLLLLLLDICDIVFSPVITSNLSRFLALLTEEHHAYYKEIYPGEMLLPKHHFMVHYPSCLLKSGPPVTYWCMRFEARHNFFKELARITRCYKNICLTLATRFQFALSSSIQSGRLIPPLQHNGPSTEIVLYSLPEISDIICKALNMCRQDFVYILNWVQLGHYKFKLNPIVLVSVCNGLPTFGSINKILAIEGNIYLILKELVTLHYDEHFHAFAVGRMDTLSLVALQKLRDHVSL